MDWPISRSRQCGDGGSYRCGDCAIQGVAFGGGFSSHSAPTCGFSRRRAMSIMEIKWGLVPDMRDADPGESGRDDILRELTYTVGSSRRRKR